MSSQASVTVPSVAHAAGDTKDLTEKVSVRNLDFFYGKSQSLKNVSLDIDVASIDTNQQQRDDHLRSADFFDVAKFPEMSFVSRSVTNVTPASFDVVGF